MMSGLVLHLNHGQIDGFKVVGWPVDWAENIKNRSLPYNAETQLIPHNLKVWIRDQITRNIELIGWVFTVPHLCSRGNGYNIFIGR